MTKKSLNSRKNFISDFLSKKTTVIATVILISIGLQAQVTLAYTSGSGVISVPSGVAKMTVECWGGGGAGGSAQSIYSGLGYLSRVGAGGGAGGSYAKTVFISPASGSYNYSVGAGGYVGTITTIPPAGFVDNQTYNGENSIFMGPTNVIAVGGLGGQSRITRNSTATYGTGGAKQTSGCIGSVVFYGGAGGSGNGNNTTTWYSGGGGGSAGAGNGIEGGDGGDGAINIAGIAGINGGLGGAMGINNTTGFSVGPGGNSPGAGGAGSLLKASNSINTTTFRRGGNGGSGQIKITYDLSSLTVSLNETFTIPLGTTLTMSAGTKIYNEGSIVNEGTIIFLSDVINGTATIIGNGTISGTGVVNVNQSLQHSETLRWWYISSPLNAAFAPIPTLSEIKSFDETNANGTTWVSTNTLEPHKGYMVMPVNAANNLLFTGTLNKGNQEITLDSRIGADNKAGLNLIGNPYLSYLNWNAVAAVNSDVLRSSTMWYSTKNSNVDNFWTVNGEGVVSPNGASASIPPMQAFWVRAIEGGGTLNLTNQMREHAPANDKLLKAPALNNRTLVRLQVSNGTNTDEAVIYTSENALNGIDKLDAPKMSNNNVSIPEIYTTLGTEKIVINSFNSLPLNSSIGLGFIAGSASSFSIKINEIANIPNDVKVILHDNITSTETDMTDASVTYYFNSETNNENRFSIIFRTPGNGTGLNNTEVLKAKVFVNANNEIVINAAEKSNYCIYNSAGVKVSQGTTSKSTLFTPRFKAGMYIVRINSLTTKVIVK